MCSVYNLSLLVLLTSKLLTIKFFLLQNIAHDARPSDRSHKEGLRHLSAQQQAREDEHNTNVRALASSICQEGANMIYYHY